jgi:hypothetical protein
MKSPQDRGTKTLSLRPWRDNALRSPCGWRARAYVVPNEARVPHSDRQESGISRSAATTKLIGFASAIGHRLLRADSF